MNFEKIEYKSLQFRFILCEVKMLLIYIETLIIDYSLSREGRVTLCTESQSIKGTVDLNCKNTIGVCFGPREGKCIRLLQCRQQVRFLTFLVKCLNYLIYVICYTVIQDVLLCTNYSFIDCCVCTDETMIISL